MKRRRAKASPPDLRTDEEVRADWRATLMSRLGWAIKGAAAQAIFEKIGERAYDERALSEGRSPLCPHTESAVVLRMAV